MRTSVEDILLRARERRLATVSPAELAERMPRDPLPRRKWSERLADDARRLDEDARKAKSLRDQGLTPKAIAERMQTTERRVFRLLKRAEARS